MVKENIDGLLLVIGFKENTNLILEMELAHIFTVNNVLRQVSGKEDIWALSPNHDIASLEPNSNLKFIHKLIYFTITSPPLSRINPILLMQFHYDDKSVYRHFMNQQQPFFFSGFLFFSLLDGTSTGMNLLTEDSTSPPACSPQTPKRSSKRQPQHLLCSWH